MVSVFLFVIVFSFYMWLSYKPHRTSDPIVQFIDNRTPIPEQPVSTEQQTTDMESATQSLPELIRPHPPDPELVEAARESAAKGEGVASQISVEELAPEVELAPTAEAPPEEMPPISVEEPEPALVAAIAEPETSPGSDAAAEEEASIQPVLTEEEAIALAVETTLAEAATAKASQGNLEDTSEPVRPNPPDPQLVEVAIRDAIEKSEDFSPPETGDSDEAEPPLEVPANYPNQA